MECVAACQTLLCQEQLKMTSGSSGGRKASLQLESKLGPSRVTSGKICFRRGQERPGRAARVLGSVRRDEKGIGKGMGTCADGDAPWLTMQELQLQVNSHHLPHPQPNSSTVPYLDDQ